MLKNKLNHGKKHDTKNHGNQLNQQSNQVSQYIIDIERSITNCTNYKTNIKKRINSINELYNILYNIKLSILFSIILNDNECINYYNILYSILNENIVLNYYNNMTNNISNDNIEFINIVIKCLSYLISLISNSQIMAQLLNDLLTSIESTLHIDNIDLKVITFNILKATFETIFSISTPLSRVAPNNSIINQPKLSSYAIIASSSACENRKILQTERMRSIDNANCVTRLLLLCDIQNIVIVLEAASCLSILSNIQFTISKDSVVMSYLTSQKFAILIDTLCKRFFENKLNTDFKSEIREKEFAPIAGIKEIGQLKDLSSIKEFVPKIKDPALIKEFIPRDTNQNFLWIGFECNKESKIRICKILSSLNWKNQADYGIKCIDNIIREPSFDCDLKLNFLDAVLNALKHNCFSCNINSNLLKWSLSVNSVIALLVDLPADNVSQTIKLIFTILSPCYSCNTTCGTVSCLDLKKMLAMLPKFIVANNDYIDSTLYLFYLLLNNFSKTTFDISLNNDIVVNDNFIISEYFFDLLCNFCYDHPIAWLILKFISGSTFINPNKVIEFILSNNDSKFEPFRLQLINLMLKESFLLGSADALSSASFLKIKDFCYSFIYKFGFDEDCVNIIKILRNKVDYLNFINFESFVAFLLQLAAPFKIEKIFNFDIDLYLKKLNSIVLESYKILFYLDEVEYFLNNFAKISSDIEINKLNFFFTVTSVNLFFLSHHANLKTRETSRRIFVLLLKFMLVNSIEVSLVVNLFSSINLLEIDLNYCNLRGSLVSNNPLKSIFLEDLIQYIDLFDYEKNLNLCLSITPFNTIFNNFLPNGSKLFFIQFLKDILIIIFPDSQDNRLEYYFSILKDLPYLMPLQRACFLFLSKILIYSKFSIPSLKASALLLNFTSIMNKWTEENIDRNFNQAVELPMDFKSYFLFLLTLQHSCIGESAKIENSAADSFIPKNSKLFESFFNKILYRCYVSSSKSCDNILWSLLFKDNSNEVDRFLLNSWAIAQQLKQFSEWNTYILQLNQIQINSAIFETSINLSPKQSRRANQNLGILSPKKTMIISRASNIVETSLSEKYYEGTELIENLTADNIQAIKSEKLSSNGALRLFLNTVSQFVSFSMNINEISVFMVIADAFLLQTNNNLKSLIPSFEEFPIIPNLTCFSNWSFNMPNGSFNVPNSYLLSPFYAKYFEYINLVLSGKYERISSGFPDYIPSFETLKYLLQYYLQTNDHSLFLEKLKVKLSLCCKMKILINEFKYELANELVHSISNTALNCDEKLFVLQPLINLINTWCSAMILEITSGLNNINSSILNLKNSISNSISLENKFFDSFLNSASDIEISKWFIEDHDALFHNHITSLIFTPLKDCNKNEIENFKIHNQNTHFLYELSNAATDFYLTSNFATLSTISNFWHGLASSMENNPFFMERIALTDLLTHFDPTSLINCLKNDNFNILNLTLILHYWKICKFSQTNLHDLNSYLDFSISSSANSNLNLNLFNSFYVENHDNGFFCGKTALLLYYKNSDYLSNDTFNPKLNLISGRGFLAFSSYCYSSVAILRSYDAEMIKFIETSPELKSEFQSYTSFTLPSVNKVDNGLDSNKSNYNFLQLSTVSMYYLMNAESITSTYSHNDFISESINDFASPEHSTMEILFKLVCQSLFEKLLISGQIKLNISYLLNQTFLLLKNLFSSHLPFETMESFFDLASNPFCRYLCLHLLANAIFQFMHCSIFLKYGFLSDCNAIRTGLGNVLSVLGNLKEFESILSNDFELSTIDSLVILLDSTSIKSEYLEFTFNNDINEMLQHLPYNLINSSIALVCSLSKNNSSSNFNFFLKQIALKNPMEICRRVLVSSHIDKEQNKLTNSKILQSFNYDEIFSNIPNELINSFSNIIKEFNSIAFLPHDLWFHVLKSSDKEKSSWRSEWQKRSKLIEDLRILYLIAYFYLAEFVDTSKINDEDLNKLWLKDYFYLFGALIYQLLIIAKVTVSLDSDDLLGFTLFGLSVCDYFEMSVNVAGFEFLTGFKYSRNAIHFKQKYSALIITFLTSLYNPPVLLILNGGSSIAGNTVSTRLKSWFDLITQPLDALFTPWSDVLSVFDISPFLAKTDFKDFFEIFDQNNIKIELIEMKKDIITLSTKTRPRKVEFIGIDGKVYKYLLKSYEDLRVDEKIQDFLSTINKISYKNQSKTDHYNSIHTYSVLPLSIRFGLIQWVENSLPIFELYKNWQNSEKPKKGTKNPIQQLILENSPQSAYTQRLAELLASFSMSSSTPRSEIPISVLSRVWTEMQAYSPTDLIKRALISSSSSAISYRNKSNNFIKSVAVNNIAGYYLGVGDRHLGNILLLDNGSVVHIDYAISFDKGKSLKVPEIVPFRLSNCFVGGLGLLPFQNDSLFTKSSLQLISSIRKSGNEILSSCSTLILDTLVLDSHYKNATNYGHLSVDSYFSSSTLLDVYDLIELLKNKLFRSSTESVSNDLLLEKVMIPEFLYKINQCEKVAIDAEILKKKLCVQNNNLKQFVEDLEKSSLEQSKANKELVSYLDEVKLENDLKKSILDNTFSNVEQFVLDLPEIENFIQKMGLGFDKIVFDLSNSITRHKSSLFELFKSDWVLELSEGVSPILPFHPSMLFQSNESIPLYQKVSVSNYSYLTTIGLLLPQIVLESISMQASGTFGIFPPTTSPIFNFLDTLALTDANSFHLEQSLVVSLKELAVKLLCFKNSLIKVFNLECDDYLNVLECTLSQIWLRIFNDLKLNALVIDHYSLLTQIGLLNPIELTSPTFVNDLWSNYTSILSTSSITYDNYCELMNCILEISACSQNLNIIFNEWDLNSRKQFNLEVTLLNGLCNYPMLNIIPSQALTGDRLRMVCNCIEIGVIDENLKSYPWYQLVEPIAKICVAKATSFKKLNNQSQIAIKTISETLELGSFLQPFLVDEFNNHNKSLTPFAFSFLSNVRSAIIEDYIPLSKLLLKFIKPTNLGNGKLISNIFSSYKELRSKELFAVNKKLQLEKLDEKILELNEGLKNESTSIGVTKAKFLLLAPIFSSFKTVRSILSSIYRHCVHNSSLRLLIGNLKNNFDLMSEVFVKINGKIDINYLESMNFESMIISIKSSWLQLFTDSTVLPYVENGHEIWPSSSSTLYQDDVCAAIVASNSYLNDTLFAKPSTNSPFIPDIDSRKIEDLSMLGPKAFSTHLWFNLRNKLIGADTFNYNNSILKRNFADKLDTDFKSDVLISGRAPLVEELEQLKFLIHESTSVEYLSRLYEGWASWL